MKVKVTALSPFSNSENISAPLSKNIALNVQWYLLNLSPNSGGHNVCIPKLPGQWIPDQVFVLYITPSFSSLSFLKQDPKSILIFILLHKTIHTGKVAFKEQEERESPCEWFKQSWLIKCERSKRSLLGIFPISNRKKPWTQMASFLSIEQLPLYKQCIEDSFKNNKEVNLNVCRGLGGRNRVGFDPWWFFELNNPVTIL